MVYNSEVPPGVDVVTPIKANDITGRTSDALRMMAEADVCGIAAFDVATVKPNDGKSPQRHYMRYVRSTLLKNLGAIKVTRIPRTYKDKSRNDRGGRPRVILDPYELVRLRDVDGLSFGKIGDRLGFSKSTTYRYYEEIKQRLSISSSTAPPKAADTADRSPNPHVAPSPPVTQTGSKLQYLPVVDGEVVVALTAAEAQICQWALRRYNMMFVAFFPGEFNSDLRCYPMVWERRQELLNLSADLVKRIKALGAEVL